MGLKEVIEALDVFPKVPEELKIKTTASGAVTIITSLIMTYLILSEFLLFLFPNITSEVGVDVSFGGKLPINYDITFPGLNCVDFGLDFVDHAGEEQLEIRNNIDKIQLPGIGCRVRGFLLTSKVQGEFHVGFGRVAIASPQYTGHRHQFTFLELDRFNASHIITKLSFGEDIPRVTHPLDGQTRIVKQRSGRFQYFIKVVPATYIDRYGTVKESNQYSFSLQEAEVDTHSKAFKQPGVFFKYDIAPYRVTYREDKQFFSHFLTQLCAILGGIYVVAGIISSGIFYVKKKVK